ncbi:MAG: ferritin family protein [Planctomycetota bacterium]
MDCKIAKNPDALLAALQEHELVIGQLYQAYSQRFPDYAHLWEKLAEEESKHAACLNSLRTQIQDDPDIVIMERFSTDAIEFSIRYVKELIERSRQPEFKIINALSLAMKLEEALLEKNYFEVLAGDTNEIRSVLDFLVEETERHFQTLKNAFGDYKANPV